jgi:lysozyme
MKLNDIGYKLITGFEGFRAKPYLCSAKVATIGYGSTFYLDGKKVTMADKPITEVDAFNMFKKIADDFANKVSDLIKKPLTQNQFNALVSISYNIGINAFSKSTLLKKVNIDDNDPNIKLEFMKWCNVNKKPNKGLINRREHEVLIYFS